jgi:hypothetical protein
VLPRRGVIEIELLRRYGRTPAGTRAVGWFEVSEFPHVYFNHQRELHIQVDGEPRVIGGAGWFTWVPAPGTPPETAEAALLERVLRDVVSLVEEQQTSAKHQRFRVVRAEWQDGSGTLSQTVAEDKKARRTRRCT